jgi:hypothetical protein
MKVLLINPPIENTIVTSISAFVDTERGLKRMKDNDTGGNY